MNTQVLQQIVMIESGRSEEGGETAGYVKMTAG